MSFIIEIFIIEEKGVKCLGIFEYYLIGVNIIGFFLYLLNMFLYSHTENAQIDAILIIGALIGGSAGILLAILLFDRKTVKDNMMSRVFIVCVFVIQVIILLMVKGHHADHITLAFWEFFAKYKILLIYLAVINFIAFVAYAVDKVNAAKHRSRIKIVTLLGLAFVGGSVGSLLAMYLLRHKTRKDYFTVGVPLIMIMQVVVIFYAMNAGW